MSDAAARQRDRGAGAAAGHHVAGAAAPPAPTASLLGLCGHSGLVVGFAVASGRRRAGAAPADMLLLGAMLCAAVGLFWRGVAAHAGRVRDLLGAGDPLPVTVPLAALSARRARTARLERFAYVYRFSSDVAGLFAWYRGLALGGTVRVSQVQLVQPFLGMLFAVPLLGEGLDAVSGVWPGCDGHRVAGPSHAGARRPQG